MITKRMLLKLAMSINIIAISTAMGQDPTAENQNVSVQQKVSALLNPLDIDKHTPQEVQDAVGADREQIVNILQSKAQEAENGVESTESRAAVAVLLLLGDQTTMNVLADRYQNRYDAFSEWFSGLFIGTKQPAIIPYIAPFLFTNESPDFVNQPMGDVGPPPEKKKSILAGRIICGVVAVSDEFNASTRKWAYELPRNEMLNRDGFREAMQDWWKDNERYLREGNYKAIPPGHLFSLPDGADPWPSILSNTHEVEHAQQLQSPLQPSPSASPNSAVQSAPSRLPFVLTIIASFGVVVALVYYQLKK